MNAISIDTKKNEMAKQLVQWFPSKGRDFPWRKTKNPFHILIAEILLRRTTATAVERVYHDFIVRFEDPELLARARISTIEKHVTSLGLQNQRARHLKQTAELLVNNFDGKVPRNFEKLSTLPGVGRYVASAVMNFAFGEPRSLVDGNVLHLISRVFDLSFDAPSNEGAWQFMDSFGSDIQQSVFYWSIIDLVAMVCIRSSPRCSVCPLNQLCSWNEKRERQNGHT